MFDKWEKCKPTFDGRILIIQYELTSRCQFTASTQGMPDDILKTLNRMIKSFLWEGGRPRLKQETLQKPISEGGKNLINLECLRDAISLMRLKSYLNISEKRPLWAYVADEMLSKAMTQESAKKFTSTNQIMNIFLQDWDIRKQQVPKYLADMIETGKRYDTTFETINPSIRIQDELPRVAGSTA
ncbi:hypothetical protein K435DRAFT_697732 [Dendrothele bispora CBS 962.96]|uniref:Uncharacterized protein n=1 Tax=Dendrothele bispora (strain CBS 962.96) TaxID=1314807 RepID=A0A4S8KUA8_DENBC|nr:hypothetical protein K435DRAFT_697732 [Dendrothele bispora CBS 962.96]